MPAQTNGPPMQPSTPLAPTMTPADDPRRAVLHNEVHARPPARIELPALVVYLAVLNDGVTREAECEHLQRLPGQQDLQIDQLAANFLRLHLGDHSLKWERHSEFTRYSLVQALPHGTWPRADAPELLRDLALPAGWLRAVPGRTIAAIELVLVRDDADDVSASRSTGLRWFDDLDAVASQLDDYACAIADFRLRPNGFERMLVIARPEVTPTRAGRISQRLLELETYRLMALLGLPVAKALAPLLRQAEAELAAITARLEDASSSDEDLLHKLSALAARVERATAEHGFRFTATQAYDALVRQRIAELKESATPGLPTIGHFMQRRLWPAIATVAATANRLGALSARIERAGALLRTRVDIAAEAQNRELLAKLTRGQELQLKLQSTVEGLSIAAISYYVISLLLYGLKAAKSAGVPLDAELTAGALIPLVVWAVWRATQRIHRSIAAGGHRP
jgi:uncharacterized membrane-anchored protein